MSDVIWTEDSIFRRVEDGSERDIEKAILQVQDHLFGHRRIYFDIKKKIGVRGGQRNIPDGYLIDLTGHNPRLYVVENELASHDPLRHIAVQILQFSLSFESDTRLIRNILFDAIQQKADIKEKCQLYARDHNFRNLDHLIDRLVYDSPFAALVIIDEIPENLEKILAERFQFGVEVIDLARYENDNGHRLYKFTPFLADVDTDVQESIASGKESIHTDELDTVVVPAHEDGFWETFIGENRWHAIRMHGTMRPQIKYIAVYRIRPLSAITHIAPVESILPWKDSGKFVVNLSEPAQEIVPHIKLVKKGHVKALQNLRYTTFERLKAAKTLDEIW